MDERKVGRRNKAATGLLVLGLAVLSFAFVPVKTVASGEITGTVRARGVKNPTDVVVYIEKVQGQFQPPNSPIQIDQIKRAYVPHVLAVLVGSEIEFLNSDNELHNVHARQNRRELFNIGVPAQRKTRRILKEEAVVTLLCDVHPEMSAFIVVTQNPFFAKVDEKGNYIIENVPPGSYTLKTWHEKLKPQSIEVKVSEGGKVQADFELRP
jgi:plastocyanin